MADPRDELAFADMANEPGMIPPGIPRIRVSPYETPPPVNDPGTTPAWGLLGGEAGRPAGRLFEPDLTPAPEQPLPRPSMVEALRTQNPAVDTRPGLPSLGESLRALPGALGSLVSGAGAYLNQPLQQAPPRPAGGMPSSISGLPPRNALPPSPDGLTPAGRAVGEVLQSPQRFIESGQGYFDPETYPGEQQQRARRQVETAADVSTNLAGLGMTGASIRGGASAGVFGGRLSKGFDPNKEKLAQTMEDNGVRPAQIWKDTGMVKFADGKWAHEIPDIGASYAPTTAARIKMSQGEQLYLPDVIPNHPKLYAAYPELRQMPVTHDAVMQASGGYLARHADTPRGKIVYREEGKEPRGQTFETLLHEIQHAISNFEGMAKGGNPHYFAPGSAADKMYQGMMAQMPSGLPAKRQAQFEQYARLTAGMKSYQHSAGENVANLTKERKDFTPEQARAVYPPAQMRVPLNEQKPFVEFNEPYGGQGDLFGQSQMGGLLNPVPREMQMSADPGRKLPEFKTVRGAEASEPGYVYHATSKENVQSIADSGRLNTHKPHEFTDQRTWPDGATEKRNYFTPTAENTWQFAPEEGSPVLLRMSQDAHPIKRESTGDLYSTKSVPAERLEYLGADNKWYPVKPKVDPGSGFELGAFGGSRPSQMGSVLRPTGLATDRQAAGYSNIKGGTSVGNMNWRVQHGLPTETRTSMPVDKALRPGDEIIPIVGDDTRKLNQGYVTEIGGQPVTPVLQQGGFDFGLSQPVDPRTGLRDIWGNAQGAATQIDNMARAAEARGNRPVIISTTMGKTGADFSHQLYNPTIELLKRNPPDAELAKVLDTFMRTKNSAGAAYTPEQFPGFASPEVWKVLDNASGAMRAKVMKALDRKTVVDAGGPDIGLIRVSQANPDLYNTPAGHMGYHIANVAPGQTGPAAHTVYPVATRGSDVRGLGGSVPGELMLPELAKGLEEMYRRTGSKEYLNRMDYYAIRPPNEAAIDLGMKPLPKTQVVTKQMIDAIGEWVHKHGLKTLPPAVAALYLANSGEAKAAPMGGVVDPSRYNAQ